MLEIELISEDNGIALAVKSSTNVGLRVDLRLRRKT